MGSLEAMKRGTWKLGSRWLGSSHQPATEGWACQHVRNAQWAHDLSHAPLRLCLPERTNEGTNRQAHQQTNKSTIEPPNL